MPIDPIKLTVNQARQARLEGVHFWPQRNEKHQIIGWMAEGDESIGKVKFQAPLETFLWVPHEPETWPWRYADLLRPLTLSIWNQKHPVEANTAKKILPIGSTVKIVMVSRFGDVGITHDLTAEHGYHARVGFDVFDTTFTNQRRKA